LPRERDGGTVQRQGGLFRRRSVLDSSGAAPSPPPPKEPRKKQRKPRAARAAPATALRSRRRTGRIALVLLGAAAVGVAGGWTYDRMTRPACDPALDPTCQQARSSTGSSARSTGWGAGRSVTRRGGESWFSWSSKDDRVGTAPRSGANKPSATRRGGFGSIGRFFSSGG